MTYNLFYLRGTDVNGQMSCKPVWFIFRRMKFATVLRVWRVQLTIGYWPKRIPALTK